MIPIPTLKQIAARNHRNEYVCHVYFVYKLAMQLQKRCGGDRRVIAAAALLHDVGRDRDNRPHEITGMEIAERELKSLGIKPKIIGQICQTIRAHGVKDVKPKTIEDKIVASADGAAKILYAPLFGLLSRKEPHEKPAWLLKYIERGYRKICIPKFKKEIGPQYRLMKHLYQESVREERLLQKSMAALRET